MSLTVKAQIRKEVLESLSALILTEKQTAALVKLALWEKVHDFQMTHQPYHEELSAAELRAMVFEWLEEKESA